MPIPTVTVTYVEEVAEGYVYQVTWTGGDGPYDLEVYESGSIYDRQMGVTSGVTLTLPTVGTFTVRVGDRTPGPVSPSPEDRLAWIPAYGQGCLTGLTVTGRDYNTELNKILAGPDGILGNADDIAYTPAVSREFWAFGENVATITNTAASRAAVGVPRIIVNLSRRSASSSKKDSTQPAQGGTPNLPLDGTAGNRARTDGDPLYFQQILDGDWDTWILKLAQQLEDDGRPVILLWMHEPHADLEAPSGTGGVTGYRARNAEHIYDGSNVYTGTTYDLACAKYIDVTRYIVDLWKTVNTRTTFAYQSTEYRLSLGDGPDAFAGTGHIDLVGYTGANGNTSSNPWKSPAERLAQAQEFLTSTGLPAAVFAGGSAEGAVSPTDKVNFYDEITAAMQSEGLMRLYVMVSTTFTDTGSVQWIDTTPEALLQWQEVVQRDYHNP